MLFKPGDKVVLNCSKEEFFKNVDNGEGIHGNCFNPLTGVAEVRLVKNYTYLKGKNPHNGTLLTSEELKYLKLKETPMKFENETKALEAVMADASKKLDELKAKALEPERAFGFLPEAGSSEQYYILDAARAAGGFGLLAAYRSYASNVAKNKYKGLFWKTEGEANEFAEAMNTFIELRAQPEVVNTTLGSQYYIDCDFDLMQLGVDRAHDYKGAISPMFATKNDARVVLDRFGSERLIKMFKALAGFKV